MSLSAAPSSVSRLFCICVPAAAIVSTRWTATGVVFRSFADLLFYIFTCIHESAKKVRFGVFYSVINVPVYHDYNCYCQERLAYLMVSVTRHINYIDQHHACKVAFTLRAYAHINDAFTSIMTNASEAAILRGENWQRLYVSYTQNRPYSQQSTW